MNINKWSNKELIKFIIARKHLTQKNLASMLANDMSKNLAESSFASKILRNGVKLDEFQAICELLGFELILKEKND